MADRDNNGRFVVGSRVGALGGRPAKEKEKEYLTAVTEAITPAELKAHILDLLTHTSWRAKYAAVELILHYGQGKPIQRTQQVDNDSMAELFREAARELQAEEKSE